MSGYTRGAAANTVSLVNLGADETTTNTTAEAFTGWSGFTLRAGGRASIVLSADATNPTANTSTIVSLGLSSGAFGTDVIAMGHVIQNTPSSNYTAATMGAGGVTSVTAHAVGAIGFNGSGGLFVVNLFNTTGGDIVISMMKRVSAASTGTFLGSACSYAVVLD